MLTMSRTLTGIPIAGQLVSGSGGSYQGLILFTGCCYVGGLAAFTAARVVAVGWRLKVIF